MLNLESHNIELILRLISIPSQQGVQLKLLNKRHPFNFSELKGR